MKNRYQLEFTAHDGHKFTLSFLIEGGRIIHLVRDVQIYQHQGDFFCEVIPIGSPPPTQFRAVTLFSPHTFSFSIIPTPEGASVYIAETSVIIELVQKNLKPIN